MPTFGAFMVPYARAVVCRERSRDLPWVIPTLWTRRPTDDRRLVCHTRLLVLHVQLRPGLQRLRRERLAAAIANHAHLRRMARPALRPIKAAPPRRRFPHIIAAALWAIAHAMDPCFKTTPRLNFGGLSSKKERNSINWVLVNSLDVRNPLNSTFFGSEKPPLPKTQGCRGR